MSCDVAALLLRESHYRHLAVPGRPATFDLDFADELLAAKLGGEVSFELPCLSMYSFTRYRPAGSFSAAIASDPGGAVDHWRLLASAVDELVSDGMPPSNRELRELLVPAIDDLPELSEMPRGFQLVLREIDRFIATCPPPEATPVTHPAVAERVGQRRGL